MSVAVASAVCDGEIKLARAQAVRKSYPTFFDDMRKLGLICTEI
jgi:5-enolpyruvylshikimate-3-phosphate synthase